jgi:hypothetical protein
MPKSIASPAVGEVRSQKSEVQEFRILSASPCPRVPLFPQLKLQLLQTRPTAETFDSVTRAAGC